MKNQSASFCGWKYHKLRNQAMAKKQSQVDFFLSIIMAFFIIIIISQLLTHLDQAIRLPSQKDLSWLNPFAVKSAYAADLEAVKMIESQADFEMLKSEKINYSVGFKNISQKAWRQSGSGKIELRRVDAYALAFKASLDSAENAPGQIGYFNTTLQAPNSLGTFTFKYVLTRDGKNILSGSEFKISIKVVASKTNSNPAASLAVAQKTSAPAIIAVSNSGQEAMKMIESQTDFEMLKSEKINYSVGFKNNSQKTWVKAGAGKIELRRKDTNALAFKASLDKAEITFGQIGYFNTTLQAPSSLGSYKFKFVLTRDAKTILSGSEFEITIKVVATKTTPSSVASALPAPSATTNAANLNKPVGLAEICLGIKPGDFQVATVDQRLLDECLKIGIKVTDEGTSYVQLGAPTVTAPITTPVNSETNQATQPAVIQPPASSTVPASTTGNGPIIRVGLYSTTDPIIITANTAYTIKDQNQAILATVPAGVQSQIIFNFSTKTYSFTANGTNLATSSYLRLVGDSQAVMEIVSLNQRPAWNPSLNDNKYLGLLEIRYSPNTNKLWVINELEMENYLKGLAETSNVSPLEYQKALVTAARTYAMYHYNRGTKHAAEYYTIDATYDQVYKGYNSQIRLPKVSQAVEETKGLVVTYNGDVVVTPYFSYDDGKTRSYQEVWGGSYKPWLVAVSEPSDYDRSTMFGHGVGLCARGALILAANHNYTFDQILKYYYTGIEVNKIY